MQQKTTVADIKRQNIQKIKRALLSLGSATKPEIAKQTDLTVATCGNILNELVAQGEALEEDFRSSNGGRPARSYRYNADHSVFLCLYAIFESGIECIRYQVSDVTGAIREKGEEKLRISAESIQKVSQRIVENHPEIRLATVGIQGCVHDGIVEFCDYPALDGIHLADKLSNSLNIPVFLENDMNSIALGYSQKNRGERNIAILFFPKGNPPAGGFLVDGNILRGSTSLAGEFSHFPFSFSKRDQCRVFSRADLAIPSVLQVVLSTIVFLDPAVILFTGSLSKELEKRNLAGMLKKALRRTQIPKLLFKSDPQEEYFAGLSQISSDHLIQT